MVELLVFGGLAAAGLAVAAVLGFVFFLLKLVLWVVLLPFRLLLKALMIPVWLTLGAVGLALGRASRCPSSLAVVAVIGLSPGIALVLPRSLALLGAARRFPFVLLGLTARGSIFQQVARRSPERRLELSHASSTRARGEQRRLVEHPSRQLHADRQSVACAGPRAG